MRTLSIQTRVSGFTIFEVLLAVVLAMILMFGALYSTSESYGVASEADKRLNTHVNARKSMDGLLKHIRYSGDLSIAGAEDTGWTLTVLTTESLNPGSLDYVWDPQTQELTVSDGTTTDVVLSGVQSFQLQQEFSGADISRVTLEWVVAVDAGDAGGAGNGDDTVALGGSTWVQRHIPMN